MGLYPSLVRNPFSWLAALSSILAFSYSISFGFIAISVISLGLILCPVIVCHTKRCEQQSLRRQQSPKLSAESVLSKSSLEDNISSLSNSLEKEVSEGLTLPIQTENEHQSVQKTDTKIDEDVSEHEIQKKKEETDGNYLLRPSDLLLSDSESHDHTISSDDYSENDSFFRENLSHSTNYSDGSISDEESLIEIALPAGHYMDSKSLQEQSWYEFQQKWPEESHFRQQNWMDMLNEMNEENFIEFDICMGSIKCSRFEIQT